MADVQPARISAIETLTPSIKRLSLDTSEHPIEFRPGQWVDLHVEWKGEPVVGGYSITSTPARRDRFELAIKRAASHRATKAVHERLSVGDEVGYAGGQGGFTLRDVTKGDAPKRLMIAGGIGITPIVSMIRHLDEARWEGALTLLYGARGASELAFRPQLDEIAARRPNFDIRYFVTGEPAQSQDGPTDAGRHSGTPDATTRASSTHQGRIDRETLHDLLTSGVDEAYLCGPPPMTESMASQLENLGLDPSRIHFERWW